MPQLPAQWIEFSVRMEGEERMFREIRGIGDETILSAIHRLPAFYFQGGWADEIRMELFRLPAGGEEALRDLAER